MPYPPLTLRSAKGAALTAQEFDDNHSRHEQRIDDILANPPQADGIANVTQAGNTITIHLQSGASLGPFTLPRAAPTAPVRDAVTGTTYTPAIGDSGRYIRLTNPLGCTVTIPTVAEVPWLTGTELHFSARTEGPVVFAKGDGVDFEDIPGVDHAAAQQGAKVTLKMTAPDFWEFGGWLAAADSA